MGLYRRGKVWWTAFMVNGRQERFSTKKRKKEDAQVEEARLMLLYRGPEADGPPPPRRVTAPASPPFELCLAAYLEARGAEGKKASSYDAFQNPAGEPVLWAKEFSGRPLASITGEEIETTLRKWTLERKWTPASRNNRLNQLSGLLSYAYGRGWIDRHPTERGRVPKLAEDNAREGWLTLEQLRTVCEKAIEQGHGYLVPIIVFEAKAGMRLGEVTGLRCADFTELDGGRSYLTLRRTKNGRVHRFPVTGVTRDFIRRRTAAARPDAYIFPGPAGGCAEASIRRHFKEAVQAAGLEWGRTRTGITFHSLRRTMASLARNDGMSVEEIARLGNWKDRRMVERYAMFADPTLERAAAELDAVSAGLNRLLALPVSAAGAGA